MKTALTFNPQSKAMKTLVLSKTYEEWRRACVNIHRDEILGSCPNDLHFVAKVIRALKLFKHGIYFKYPLCCIIQFVKEDLGGHPAAMLRIHDFDPKNDFNEIEHIPCNWCAKKIANKENGEDEKEMVAVNYKRSS